MHDFALEYSEHHIDQLRSAFHSMNLTFDKIDEVQDKIEDMLRQVERLRDITLSRKRVAELLNLKDNIVAQMHLVVSQVNQQIGQL